LAPLQGSGPAPIFYPFEHPTPYAYASISFNIELELDSPSFVFSVLLLDSLLLPARAAFSRF
jgi:hypothetical protein